MPHSGRRGGGATDIAPWPSSTAIAGATAPSSPSVNASHAATLGSTLHVTGKACAPALLIMPSFGRGTFTVASVGRLFGDNSEKSREGRGPCRAGANRSPPISLDDGRRGNGSAPTRLPSSIRRSRTKGFASAVNGDDSVITNVLTSIVVAFADPIEAPSVVSCSWICWAIPLSRNSLSISSTRMVAVSLVTPSTSCA